TGDLLLKIKAAGVNRADVLQRQGRYPPPPGASPTLGLEASGFVEQVGTEVEDWCEGDRACALLAGGGYAEHVAVPAGLCMPIPEGLSFEQAAAIPEVFATAYQTLFWLGDLQFGGRVLIHAGASGVGTAAIQLAREAGAHPIVTAGSERKLDACRALGAELAIDYKRGPFAPAVLEATDERGVDVILDFVAAPYWEQNLQCLAPEGRLILIGSLGGTRVEGFDLRVFLTKRLQVTGTTLRARSLDYKVRLVRALAAFALPRFADGRLRPIVDRVFSWAEVAKAHRYMEENRNIGKIVLAGM
ncbi:MAG: NAD(P)H-quinone oxidoreductase, partial [Gemmatimonadetes bacterium]|nr:NAD(P)H-quinone oxidoreductase [Gemmatimonadota bacterium]